MRKGTGILETGGAYMWLFVSSSNEIMTGTTSLFGIQKMS
jgi:hypothetical protein